MATESKNTRIIIISSISLVAVIGIVILVIYLRKWILANKENSTLESEIKKKNLTLTQSEYDSSANSMWAAVADGITEDTDSMLHIISLMKTADDWKALKLAFNQKYGNTSSFWNKGDLPYWITKKTPEIIPQINTMLNQFGESI